MKSSTTNHICLGETNIAPIALDIEEHMIVYWTRTCNGNTDTNNN